MFSSSPSSSEFGVNGVEGEEEAVLEAEAEREAESRLDMEGRVSEEDEDWEPLPGDKGDGAEWKLPTAGEVEEELLERRRRKLLDTL